MIDAYCLPGWQIAPYSSRKHPGLRWTIEQNMPDGEGYRLTFAFARREDAERVLAALNAGRTPNELGFMVRAI
ncbi:hypothetical protein [Planktothrix phage Pra-JY27]|nr:apolipoprotein(a) [Planktothrix phage Pag-Yong1]WEV89260.1 hypothetical protein [Synechococcus phage MinM2]